MPTMKNCETHSEEAVTTSLGSTCENYKKSENYTTTKLYLTNYNDPLAGMNEVSKIENTSSKITPSNYFTDEINGCQSFLLNTNLEQSEINKTNSNIVYQNETIYENLFNEIRKFTNINDRNNDVSNNSVNCRQMKQVNNVQVQLYGLVGFYNRFHKTETGNSERRLVLNTNYPSQQNVTELKSSTDFVECDSFIVFAYFANKNNK
ncbi:unnamed protein product [Heterobilharzia americana]|nr:unnamed protein product [Heterobilharzia americana]CAH8660229.1 unnamed protein product [Heterobilharzia americana]